MGHKFHITVLSGELRQAGCCETDREWVGCLLPVNIFINTGQRVAEVVWENHPDMRVPSVEIPTCAAFDE